MVKLPFAWHALVKEVTPDGTPVVVKPLPQAHDAFSENTYSRMSTMLLLMEVGFPQETGFQEPNSMLFPSAPNFTSKDAFPFTLVAIDTLIPKHLSVEEHTLLNVGVVDAGQRARNWFARQVSGKMPLAKHAVTRLLIPPTFPSTEWPVSQWSSTVFRTRPGKCRYASNVRLRVLLRTLPLRRSLRAHLPQICIWVDKNS